MPAKLGTRRRHGIHFRIHGSREARLYWLVVTIIRLNWSCELLSLLDLVV